MVLAGTVRLPATILCNAMTTTSRWPLTYLLALISTVRPIPNRSFKEFDEHHRFRTFVLIVIALVLVVWEPSVTLFAIGIVYIVTGAVEAAWRWYKGKPLEELSEPLPSEPS